MQKCETRRIGVIGAGRIGSPVIDWLSGQSEWVLTSILVRNQRPVEGRPFTTSCEEFLATRPEVIIEMAGPAALRSCAIAALAIGEVWTISAAALVDPVFSAAVAQACHDNDHRLRIVSGAIGGLDGVATAFALDASASLRVNIRRPAQEPAGTELFAGALVEAVRALPDEVNVAAAAAWAGGAVARTHVTIHSTGLHGEHCIAVQTEGRAGKFEAVWDLNRDPLTRIHPVAASIVAALRKETLAIRVG